MRLDQIQIRKIDSQVGRQMDRYLASQVGRKIDRDRDKDIDKRIVSQTVYCWGSQFSLQRCPPLSRWGCPALWMFLFTCLSSFVSQSAVFTCLPSSVSQSGWWCQSLWMSFYLSPFICLLLCLVVSGSRMYLFLLSLVSHHVSLARCLPFICLPF